MAPDDIHHPHSNSTNHNKVKKLRLLLQAGAELGAVQQKAKLEGIDMKSVLSPSTSSKQPNNKDNDDDNENSMAIPETLVKKYRRMLKAGLPLNRVQQLAGVEAGVAPEVVEYILKKNDDSNNIITQPNTVNTVVNAEADDPFTKFVRMQKAGIPLAAIQNSARIQGVNVDELNAVLVLVRGGDANNKLLNTGKDEERDDDASVAEPVDGKEEIDSVDETSKYFTSVGAGGVAFPSGRGHPLTDIVRKMAQTVQRTSRFSNTSAGNDMIVDGQTLFHALGAFRGVQFALDEYNSTIGKEALDVELIHAKCHAFAEMARSIGMALPDDAQAVNIPGLDELISHIESTNKVEIDRSNSLLKDGYYDFDSLQSMYQPGSFVMAKHAGGGGVDAMCQVVWNRYKQGKTIFGKTMKYFELCVRFIYP